MMNQPMSFPRRQAQRGIAMVEALIAVLILSIGLVGTLGLQVHSQKALAEAGMRSEATIAASELIGVMSNDLGNVSEYALTEGAAPGARLAAWHAQLLKFLPGASAAVGVVNDAGSGRIAVTITIKWKRDAAATENRHRIVTYLARSA